ncbi:MAG TPA: metallophosphoesterase, partial [Candidatus Thermoplasmatota archaeon]|nr:metallophosphoesterase [Candidatus Thermoplasmatota archaeon]
MGRSRASGASPEHARSARGTSADVTHLEFAPGLVALAEGALWMPDERVLAVADLHVGYEAWHAARGTAVPRVETRVLARTIRRLVARLAPDRLVVDGDVVHARTPRTHASERRALAAVLDAADGADLVLVAGNHDRALAELR